MMAREMKNSGVQWIGDIPSNWGTLSPRYWVSQRDAGNWGTDERGDELDIICIRIADFDYTRYCIKKGYEYTLRNYPNYLTKKLCLQKGDILIEKSGGGEKFPVGRTVMYDLDKPALFANFSERIRIKESYYAKFALYAFVAHYGCGLSRLYFNQTTGLQNLIMSEFMSEVKLPLPPLSEQKAIAAFLDSKCGEIDGLLADLDAEVKTLTEYKKSIIAETVTKGLNPNVPMKPSGIPWADTIPAHWGIEKFRYKLKARRISGFGEKQVLSVYREFGVIPKDSREDNHNVTSEDTSKYKYVRPNDFVINKMKAWQGSMGVSEHEGIVSPAYFVYEFSDDDYYPRYFHYFMRNTNNIPEYRRLSGGIREGQWDLSPYDLGNMPIIIPPIEEQNEIVRYLDEKCAAIEQSITDKQAQIETLKGYKSSLIYEYVTGKKQVAK